MLPRYCATSDVGALPTQSPRAPGRSKACGTLPPAHSATGWATLTVFIATVRLRAGASIALPVTTTRSRTRGTRWGWSLPGVSEGASTTWLAPRRNGGELEFRAAIIPAHCRAELNRTQHRLCCPAGSLPKRKRVGCAHPPRCDPARRAAKCHARKRNTPRSSGAFHAGSAAIEFAR